jgi:formylmethanofuran dehydrogenase subunit B
MGPSLVKSATCTYCGCLCDDIELHAENQRIVRATHACTLGRAWFFGHPVDSSRAQALVHGRPATMRTAVDAAARMLDRANLPLIFGLGNSTGEAQRAAILLAEQVGGVLDTHTSLTHGPSKIAAQLVGKVSATLGEVRNRADLVIYWGSNPVESHPRHLTKFSFTPRGRFVPRGRYDRALIVVDVRETLTSRAATRFLQIRPGTDFEVLTTLRALAAGHPVDPAPVARSGLTLDQLAELVERMKGARFGAFFYGSGLSTTRGKHMNVAALLSLTASLNAFTKFVAVPMRDYGNEAGADNIMSGITGYPFGVDFARGYPRSNPGEFTAVDLLVRQEADAALIVAADPWSTMPQAAIDHLQRIPHIVIDRANVRPRRTAGVHFTAAAPGISSGGTAYRMDKVPVTLRPALQSPEPSDEDVLLAIHQAVVGARDSQTSISPLPGTLVSPV